MHVYSFNQWSRHEPIMFTKTDHWSKQRAKVRNTIVTNNDHKSNLQAYQLTRPPIGPGVLFHTPEGMASYH